MPGQSTPAPSKLYAATRSQGFGEEVKRRILLGGYALSAECVTLLVGITPDADCRMHDRAFDNYFLKAQKVRLLLRREFDDVFRVPSALVPTPAASPKGVDVLVMPTALTPAPVLPSPPDSAETASEGEAQERAQRKIRDAWAQDVLLVPASLAGLPAISVPVSPILAPEVEEVRKTRRSGWTGDEGEESRPVGVQIVAQWGGEETVLRVAEEVMKMPQF